MTSLFQIMLKIPAAMIALTVGSYARHLAAYTQGDYTPKLYGKLTLMPTEHLDPVGFIMMVFFRFGWSKPPAINPSNFKNGKISMLIYFLSSPVANLLTAIVLNIVSSILVKFNIGFPFLSEILMVVSVTIMFNIAFASIAFIPFPPFTGYYILKEFLPYSIRYKVSQIERYSLLILIALIYTGFLGIIINPIYMLLYNIVSLFGGIA